jgi:hypothetical protein
LYRLCFFIVRYCEYLELITLLTVIWVVFEHLELQFRMNIKTFFLQKMINLIELSIEACCQITKNHEVHISPNLVQSSSIRESLLEF